MVSRPQPVHRDRRAFIGAGLSLSAGFQAGCQSAPPRQPSSPIYVVDTLLARNVDESVIRAVCFGNYARCLRQAMVRRRV